MPDTPDIEDLKYEIKVLKGKLDEKQKVDIGLTPNFRAWHFWRIKRLANKLEHHQRKVKI